MLTTSGFEATHVEVPATLAVQLATTCAPGSAQNAAAHQALFASLGELFVRNGLAMSGPPRVIYNTGRATASLTLAIPIATAPARLETARDIIVGMLAGGHALRFEHDGPFDTLGETHDRIDAWMRHGLCRTPNDLVATYAGMWEEHFGDASTLPDSAILTRIYLPLDGHAHNA